jgi:hypothetical protein
MGEKWSQREKGDERGKRPLFLGFTPEREKIEQG